ncbi:DUF3624 family protein [Celerinatantimonas diazotrophica]|uniref:Uncharacterized protein DUF3624 n=2 Tax=Celerinatantimonas diazotrophica TaxID=412034 RepID=A0A4R1K174_9GAMM|nr:uncharacterized protein DUF3624 [Celerinatantimonas diazotrophica]CAG9298210.1 hypothetical protein CEDIAZO_03405 [Celerinatantimonas diazotrophica]
MSCQRCSSDWFWQKLGRCRQCILLNVLLLLIGIATLWWSESMTPVYRWLAIFVTGSAALLLVAHLVMALYYKVSGETKLN